MDSRRQLRVPEVLGHSVAPEVRSVIPAIADNDGGPYDGALLSIWMVVPKPLLHEATCTHSPLRIAMVGGGMVGCTASMTSRRKPSPMTNSTASSALLGDQRMLSVSIAGKTFSARDVLRLAHRKPHPSHATRIPTVALHLRTSPSISLHRCNCRRRVLPLVLLPFVRQESAYGAPAQQRKPMDGNVLAAPSFKLMEKAPANTPSVQAPPRIATPGAPETTVFTS